MYIKNIVNLFVDLFHRAIVQSGTALTRGLSMNNSAVYIGEALGLDTKNGTKLMQGLRNLTEQEILDVQEKIDVYVSLFRLLMLFYIF